MAIENATEPLDPKNLLSKICIEYRKHEIINYICLAYFNLKKVI